MTSRRSQPIARARHWTPDAIPWQEQAEDGTRYALLEGRRDIDGEPFTYAFHAPAGFWDPPHAHTQDARILVVRGRLLLGYGKELDRSRVDGFRPGSLLFVPAHALHFDGAEEDTLILGLAQGPWRTQYTDPRQTGSAGTPAGEGG